MGLPEPLGPFQVAFGDFELQRATQRGSKDELLALNKMLEDLFRLELPHPPLMRIFYPTAKAPPKCGFTGGRFWLPHFQYMYGYCSRAFPPLDLGQQIKCGTTAVLSYMYIKPQAIIQASVQEPPLPPDSEGGAGIDRDGKLPVVIFTHGLWAMRTTYSTFCCDIASHGYVVVAIEHQDGSASTAQSTQPDGSVVWIKHEPMGADIENVPDAIRMRQLRQRGKEFRSVMYVLDGLTAGTIPEMGNCVKGPSRLSLAPLAGRLDMRQVAVSGHSFGGVAASLMCDEDERVKCCIGLDTWWTPLMNVISIGPRPGGTHSVERGGRQFLPTALHQDAGGNATANGRPLLMVNTSLFGGPKLSDARNKYIRRRKEKHADAVTISLTIQGSAHLDQSDLPLILANYAKFMSSPIFSGPLGAFKTRSITSKASLEFLSNHFIPPERGYPYKVTVPDDELSNVWEAVNEDSFVNGKVDPLGQNQGDCVPDQLARLGLLASAINPRGCHPESQRIVEGSDKPLKWGCELKRVYGV